MAQIDRLLTDSSSLALAAASALGGTTDFYDDFTAGTAGAFASGRAPRIGANTWIVSGAGVAQARAGGAAGFTSAAANGANQNIYAVMKLNSGKVPLEVGGVFVWTGSFATLPTIAIVKDYPTTGIDVMLHANLYAPSLSAVTFAPGYWPNASSPNTAPAFNLPIFGTSGPSGTLVLGQEYTRRIRLDRLSYVDETIEDATGTVIASCTWYDANLSGVVGPWVFFEGNGSDLSWKRVWAKNAPDPAATALMQRASGRAPAPGFAVYSGIHIGSGAPKGLLSMTMTDEYHRPSVAGSGIYPSFDVIAKSVGYGAEFRATCWLNVTAAFGIDNGANAYLSANGANFLKKLNNGDLVIPDAGVALRLGGESGPRIIPCTGTPEGAVTAPVGSIAVRTDGGAGSTLYVKQSGTGNTGWAAK